MTLDTARSSLEKFSSPKAASFLSEPYNYPSELDSCSQELLLTSSEDFNEPCGVNLDGLVWFGLVW